MTMGNELVPGNQEVSFAAEWLVKRDAAVTAAASITEVVDDRGLEVAGAAQTQLTRLAKELEAERMAMTRPLDAFKRKIMNKAKELLAPVDMELGRLKGLNTAYATRKAREAEEERRRIEALRREQAEREAKEQAEREAAARAEAQAMFGEGAVVEVEPVEVAPSLEVVAEMVPEVAPPRTASNTFVEVWKFEVVDEQKVPREFCSVDEQKLRGYMQYQKGMKKQVEEVKVAGVRFWKEMSVRAR